MNKGISPIIATLLLIFIATVAVVLIWFWLPSLRTESRGSVSVLLKIEAVSVSSNRLTLYIRNIGNEEIKIDKVSLDDPATGLSKYIVDVGPLTLKPGQLETVNVSLPTGIQAGKYALRVLSTSGISIATYVLDISSVSQQPLQFPLFSIVSYNSTILGAPSSSERLVVGLVNDGGASGVAVVRVLDSSGNVASSASVSLSPGQRTDVSLSVVLPPASGNYQWRIIAINNVTGNQDDAKTVLVQVVTYTPVFYIASYTGNITGAVSSRQLFDVTVTNSGNATGTVRVRVLDQAGNTVNGTVLAVPPGASVATSLALTLPSSSGTYSWTVQAVDNATGTIHDSKPITVRAVVYQPKFSIQSYNTSITGAAGSKQKIVVAVANTGNATGAVQVNIIDNNGNTLNSTTLSIPAGQTATTTLTVTLPSSRGTYTWRINVTNQATGKIDDTKTLLVTVKDIYLQSRCALIYTPFESLPSGWSSIGGSWSIAPGYGVGGTSALKGVDNDAGPGGDSVYYWQSSVSSYANLYALVQVTNVNSNDRIYVGYGLLESASSSSRLYEVSLYARGQSVRLNIYLWTGASWIELSNIDVPYSGTTYVLFLSFSKSGTLNSISATLYDQGGNALGSTSSTNSLFSVNYFGLIVDQGTGYFDNLVVASTCDPRYVQVNGLSSGWTAELRDSSGNLVSSAVAGNSGTATLSVLKLPVILNGSIIIKDQYGSVIIQKTFSQVVGGDTYSYG
ncbi:MAG: hypothetical protein QXX32_01500 [Thermofilum sp.]